MDLRGSTSTKKVATCPSWSNVHVHGFGREVAPGKEGVQLLFHHKHLKQPSIPMKKSLELFKILSYFFDRRARMMDKVVFDKKHSIFQDPRKRLLILGLALGRCQEFAAKNLGNSFNLTGQDILTVFPARNWSFIHERGQQPASLHHFPAWTGQIWSKEVCRLPECDYGAVRHKAPNGANKKSQTDMDFFGIVCPVLFKTAPGK